MPELLNYFGSSKMNRIKPSKRILDNNSTFFNLAQIDTKFLKNQNICYCNCNTYRMLQFHRAMPNPETDENQRVSTAQNGKSFF